MYHVFIYDASTYINIKYWHICLLVVDLRELKNDRLVLIFNTSCTKSYETGLIYKSRGTNSIVDNIIIMALYNMWVNLIFWCNSRVLYRSTYHIFTVLLIWVGLFKSMKINIYFILNMDRQRLNGYPDNDDSLSLLNRSSSKFKSSFATGGFQQVISCAIPSRFIVLLQYRIPVIYRNLNIIILLGMSHEIMNTNNPRQIQIDYF